MVILIEECQNFLVITMKGKRTCKLSLESYKCFLRRSIYLRHQISVSILFSAYLNYDDRNRSDLVDQYSICLKTTWPGV
jgi:hypothetical protein